MYMRHRFPVLQQTVTGTVLLGLLAAPGHADTLPSPSGHKKKSDSTQDADICAPLPLQKSYYLTPDGHSTSKKTGQTATVRVFEDAGGSPTQVVVPPRNFDPLSASTATLRRFGFPHRPEGHEALAAWKHTNVKKHYRQISPMLCRSKNSHRPARATIPDTSVNWTGVRVKQSEKSSGPQQTDSTGPFVQASSNIDQPNYFDMDTCAEHGPNRQAHALWAGLGGSTGSTGLLQNGTDIDTDGHPFAWYEAIHTKENGDELWDTQQIKISSDDFSITPGDTVFASTSYTPPSEETGTGSVLFAFSNLSSLDYVSIIKKSIDGVPAKLYYDGSTAEVIGERTMIGGADASTPYAELAYPNSGYIHFEDSWFFRGDYGQQHYDRIHDITMVEPDDNELAHTENITQEPLDITWDEHWNQCGTGKK